MDNTVMELIKHKVKMNDRTTTNEERKKTCLPLDASNQSEQSDHMRPKSRKELRAEKKALKKAEASKSDDKITNKQLSREEKKKLRKENIKIAKRQLRIEAIKEQREKKKLKKQKRRRMEMNAPGGINAAKSKKLKRNHQQEKIETDSQNTDHIMNANIYNDLFNGTRDETTGTTTLRMGVKYKDIVLGKGRVAEERMLVNVSYKLTGGQHGAVIDSSKNFSFRLGKGEVIKGWDIGLIGMQEGGRRHLIVPPKAGYGSQDIGAGSGATLFFDITLLSIR